MSNSSLEEEATGTGDGEVEGGVEEVAGAGAGAAVLEDVEEVSYSSSIVYLSLISFSNGSYRCRHGGSARAGWEVSFSNPS